MGRRRARQLRLDWRDRETGLPKAVEEEARALLAQLLRLVVEAERDHEEGEDE